MLSRRGGSGDEWYVEHLGEQPLEGPSRKESRMEARGKLYEVMVHYGYEKPKGIGRQWVRCPFHDDRHASGGVDWSTNFFTCFACEVKGTAIDIVMQQEGVDLDGAVSFIAAL